MPTSALKTHPSVKARIPWSIPLQTAGAAETSCQEKETGLSFWQKALDQNGNRKVLRVAYLAGLPSSWHNAQTQHTLCDVITFIGIVAISLGDNRDVHILQWVRVLGYRKERSKMSSDTKPSLFSVFFSIFPLLPAERKRGQILREIRTVAARTTGKYQINNFSWYKCLSSYKID